MARIQRASSSALIVCLLLAALGRAQTSLITLEAAGSRIPPDLAAAYDGQEITVLGQVSARSLWSGSAYYLPVQDTTDHGLILMGARPFAGMEPGDWIVVRGQIQQHAGMPVMLPADIQHIRHTSPPAPKPVSLAEQNTGRYVGVLVSLDARIMGNVSTVGGDILTLGGKPNSVEGFHPRLQEDSSGVEAFHPGDRAQLTGISAQYCLQPPYNRHFIVLVADGSSITLLEKAWLVSPWFLFLGMIFLGFLLALWWFREQRLATQRWRMRLLNRLGEEIIAAASPADILGQLDEVLPKIAPDLRAVLYVFNRVERILDRIAAPGSEPHAIHLESTEAGTDSGAALCFRERTLLTVPDTQESPFFAGEETKRIPRSVMFVPMCGPTELLGVLQVHHLFHRHSFTQDEQTAMQHLANQAGTSLRLQEQKSIRERLLRTERLAAAGKLISGIAGELQSPLDDIAELAALLKAPTGVPDPRIELIQAKAQGASEIVSRLIAFGNSDDVEVKPIDLHAMLAHLLYLRADERKSRGLEMETHFVNQRVMVLGSLSQLEQVFLNLLVHGEQAAADAQKGSMSLSTNLLAGTVIVDVAYEARPLSGFTFDPFGNASLEGALNGIGLCRGIAQSHGGDLRVNHPSPTLNHIEVELPVMETQHPSALPAPEEFPISRRPLTVLLVEPEGKSQRQVLELLSKRGERVVPVSSAEEAVDLAQRLRFDLTICSVRLPGLNWVELFERVRRYVGTFVLVTPGYDPDLMQAFESGEGFVLNKPIDSDQLNEICDTIAGKLSTTSIS